VRANIAPLNAKGNNRSVPNPSTRFPVVIAEWPRNKREVVRVSLDEYQGRKIIDCRSWWYNDEDELKPGRSGLTLALKHLPNLAQGLADALARARALGFSEVQGTD
jgi:hypothetical protein